MLVYFARLAGSPVNDLGRTGAYLALFSEIGIILFTTSILGVLAGYWLDQQLRTLPIFVLVGLLIGFGAGALAVYRLVTRFLARFE